MTTEIGPNQLEATKAQAAATKVVAVETTRQTRQVTAQHRWKAIGMGWDTLGRTVEKTVPILAAIAAFAWLASTPDAVRLSAAGALLVFFGVLKKAGLLP